MVGTPAKNDRHVKLSDMTFELLMQASQLMICVAYTVDWTMNLTFNDCELHPHCGFYMMVG